MSDLIERQAAIDLAGKAEDMRLKGEIDLTYAEMVKGLMRLPSAKPKKGEWIPVEDDIPYGILVECSECGRRIIINDAMEHNYCDHCGAKMER